jgi:Kef-type K+ transport system membrane component KefB
MRRALPPPRLPVAVAALAASFWAGEALAGAAALPSLVQDIGLSLLLAGVLSIVFTRLRIPTIAAFLVAGVAAGPIGMRFITNPENIDTISQLGLVLLLFVIGLEIDIRKLLASGKTLLVAGMLGYPLSVVLGFVMTKLLIMLGIGESLLAGGSYVPLYVGIVIAPSSTLLVFKLFKETFQLDTVVGRISLGILIFQDIWSIIVIAVQPRFDDPQIGPILVSFAGIGVLVAVAVLLARLLMPVGFRWIAKLPEVIVVAAVAWCFLIVFAGLNLDVVTQALLGINLHLAVGPGMGALIAGASIASLPYSTEIIGKVGIVKDFFVTLFFVGLGTSIPMPDGPTVLALAVIFAALTIVTHLAVLFPLLYATGLDRRNAFVSAARLSQISEFSLVIAFLGVQFGHISGALNGAVIFAFVITALLTPWLFRRADALHEALGPWLARIGFATPEKGKEADAEAHELALLGFHRTASSLLYEIGRTAPELLGRTLVVDFNVAIHRKIASLGPKVVYGDLANTETLHHTGVDKAKVVVCTIPDDLLVGTSNRRLVAAVRHMNPGAIIIANAIETREPQHLYEAGADYVFLPRVEIAQAVSHAIMKALRGEIASHRAEVGAIHGEWHERREVFD